MLVGPCRCVVARGTAACPAQVQNLTRLFLRPDLCLTGEGGAASPADGDDARADSGSDFGGCDGGGFDDAGFDNDGARSPHRSAHRACSDLGTTCS